MPSPATAKAGSATSHVTSWLRTSSIPARPATVTAKPARTNRWGGQRAAPRACIQAPDVHVMVAAVRASPASVADRPRHSTRVSATNASTPKKAQVRTPRSRIAAGRTGRATSVPGGVRRRNAKIPSARPTALRTTVGTSRPVVSPTVSNPDPRATMMASGSRPRRAADRAGSAGGGHVGDGAQRPEGEGSRQRDEWQQPEEDVAPADRVADRPGDRRTDDAGQDPRRRQRREHPRPERLGEGPSDGDVGDRLDRARTETLEEPRRRPGSASMAPGRR